MSANDGENSENGENGDDGGPGRRETAQRLFAAEFEDATFSYSESEEERAPNYVVAPSGARVNRLFAVGVLTEVEPVSENVLRGRIVDPTGAFVTYAGQYQPDALAFLERVEPPAFVAVTGKARTFQPEDSDVIYTSVRPETMNEVDADTRDRWVVNAAERTRERVGNLRDAKRRPERGDDLESALRAEGAPEALAAGAPRALDAYGTTDDYLDDLESLSTDAVRVVAGDREEAGSLDIAPGEGEDRGAEPAERAETEADERTSELGDPVGTDDAAGAPASPEPAAEPGETVETEAPEADGSEPTVASGTDAGSETGEPDAAPADEPASEEPSEPESTSRTEAEADERESELGDPIGTDETAGAPAAAEPAAEPGETVEEEAASTGATADPEATDGTDDPEATDELYEFDEEERREVEEEHGLEFSTGGEVESADELGDFESGLDAESEASEPGDGSEPDEPEAADEPPEGEPADAEGESAVSDEPAEAENPVDAAVELMGELGDGGGGVERGTLVSELVSRHGMDEDGAEEAIEDALMSGRCYESGDDELTPI
jgi:RPA family protein